ncbi:MAG: PAS domain-containing protein [Candidatus Heimdallarchaeota archaeon]|nr:PAS domain-containing protein [Candidatus Heimdallarchaeota archaeon]
MYSICAWCKKSISGEHEENAPISHGICDSCMIDLVHSDDAFDGLIDTISTPILVFDEEVRLKTANKTALEILHKTKEELVDLLGGEVIQCIYSEMEVGCGNTEHCPACILRNTINETLETKKSKSNIETTHLIRQADNSVRNTSISVTSELISQLVMLQINDISSTSE